MEGHLQFGESPECAQVLELVDVVVLQVKVGDVAVVSQVGHLLQLVVIQVQHNQVSTQ